MNRKPKYDFIREQLAQYSAPDTESLWQGMNTMLDAAMPEEKEKRPYAWLNTTAGIFTILTTTSLSVLIICLTIRSAGPSPAHQTHIVFKAIPESNHRKENARAVPSPTSITPIGSERSPSQPVATNRKKHIVKNEVQAVKLSPAVQQQYREEPVSIKRQTVDAVSSAKANNKELNAQNITSGITNLSSVEKNIGGLPVSDKLQNELLTPSYNAEGTAASTEAIAANFDNRIRYIAPRQHSLKLFSSEQHAVRMNIAAAQIALVRAMRSRGFTAGISANLNLPVSRQEMSTVHIN